MKEEEAKIYMMKGILADMATQEPDLVAEVQADFDTLVRIYNNSKESMAVLMLIAGIFAVQEGMKS